MISVALLEETGTVLPEDSGIVLKQTSFHSVETKYPPMESRGTTRTQSENLAANCIVYSHALWSSPIWHACSPRIIP